MTSLIFCKTISLLVINPFLLFPIPFISCMNGKSLRGQWPMLKSIESSPVFYYDQNRFSILCQYKKGGWKVKFENTGLENLTAELKVLDEVLPKYGFTRAEH